MRSAGLINTLVGLLPLAALPVQASRCKPRNDDFCAAHVDVVSALHVDAAATPYCLSYLSVSTVTVESTVSVTPPASVDIVSSTITAETVTSTVVSEDIRSSESTVISTHVSFSTSTITLTTSTTTVTCLNSAYYVPRPFDKRGDGTAKRRARPPTVLNRTPVGEPPVLQMPDEIPVDWPASAVSQICSCLALPTPTTTVEVTVSLDPSIQIVTRTATHVPSATVTSVLESLALSTYTSVLESVTLVYETEYAVATAINTDGGKLNYRRYDSPYNADNANSGFTSSQFSPNNPDRPGVLSTGMLASLTFSTPNWPNGGTYLDLDGDSFDSAQAAILFQGFFVAQQQGTYYLETNENYVDNYAYMWTGDDAYSMWNDDNAAFKASRTGDGNFGGYTTLDLYIGDAVPITYLWANGGGVGQSYIVMYTPGGVETTDLTGYFVPACDNSVFA
ncbi:hypothetical protein SBRCBS47491_004701 [Sporothrix bragantina]|uniref:PA14 domain-containing protein n=1 Tax=Sporothrix bragantina TaxID=671064 RepID=A0ABP0BQY9_9PEZI